jgi:transcriptional regulator with XRE-family HTH domain
MVLVSDPLAELGVRLQEARIGAGLTQVQLAEALGVSFSEVRRFERDLARVLVPVYVPSRRRAPSWLAEQVARWAEVTGADQDWLLFGKPPG